MDMLNPAHYSMLIHRIHGGWVWQTNASIQSVIASAFKGHATVCRDEI